MLTRPGRRSTSLSSVAGWGLFPALADWRALSSLAWRTLLTVALRVAHIVGGLELSGSEAEKAPGVNLVCREQTSETIVSRFLSRFQTRWHPAKGVWTAAVAGPKNSPFLPRGRNLLPVVGSVHNTTCSPNENPGMGGSALLVKIDHANLPPRCSRGRMLWT